MTTHYEIDTSDEDDDDDDFLFDDDDWEDSDFPASVKAQYVGWHLMKITNFNSQKLRDIDEWAQENTKHGQFKRVGWRSGCSTSVGVVIESARDAMMFKLRWA